MQDTLLLLLLIALVIIPLPLLACLMPEPGRHAPRPPRTRPAGRVAARLVPDEMDAQHVSELLIPRR